MREVLSQFPYINLVIVGQLLFFGIFLGALLWVFRSGSRAFYDQLAQAPLNDELTETHFEDAKEIASHG